MRIGPVLLLGAVAALLWLPAARAGDSHAGYYYPEPGTSEVYEARAQPLPDSDRQRRIGFVTVLTGQMLQNPYPPQFVIFAKGTEAEKLIIAGLADGRYDTLYRARALFAMLTAMSRATPYFREQEDAGRLTFFDLARLLGFTRITVTVGDRFAHQVELR